MTELNGQKQALLLDFGGVLTPSIGRMFRVFEVENELEDGTLFRAMADAYGDGGQDSHIAQLERGEMTLGDFETALAGAFTALGHAVDADGLVNRIFAGLVPSGRLWDAALIARRAGIRTGLLSNSWSTEGYPDELLATHFDDVVISGEVGLRKPDPAIYRLAAERVGVAVSACVFVDDLDTNVEVARTLGMAGVHHAGDEHSVLEQLSTLLGVDLSSAVPHGA